MLLENIHLIENMNKYLLDTNIVVYLENKQSPYHQIVTNRLSKLSEDDNVYISLLTFYELYYGISKAPFEYIQSMRIFINSIESRFITLSLTKQGAEIFGEIKTKYHEKTGIGEKELSRHNIDFIIASTAIKENATLVSNDNIFKHISEFRNDLKLENWTIDKSEKSEEKAEKQE